ncbi:RNA polymerase sigma-70 factor (sigma-E family) [Allocatelliglobosispora scoriae]|uniref:RNA polymerase sigma-70 factor (Sigma-E family) n=1 Tax=Allocatelliglobosispora scoriae TaxID=643052 RepID=A0A841BZQ8_9ACTN|nr:SigE family RNA polymerase sigma factor [Allocatelliglobosispora scoriae]MBB5873076.1 RNA polymerase sigma-70 factor (sigma-E family) [Allocatelliglobosispora scoriae]
MEPRDFDTFYSAHFADTVALTYAYTGDLAGAQDLTQEAFSRAWQRWASVSTYDQPVAWVRHVALNLARSRWRHLRVATAYLLRQRADDAPPPEPDHVALVAALRTLPENQRRAIVLHHLMDLPVSEVAREMSAAEGTVKSWLSRGRAGLATTLGAEMRAEVGSRVTAPPAVEVRAKAEHQRRVRRAAGAVVAVLVVLLVVASQLLPIRQNPLPPITPSPSVSPTPAPTGPVAPQPLPLDPRPTGDPLATRDWSAVSIRLVSAERSCPRGLIRFTRTGDGPATGPSTFPKAVFEPSRVLVGDLNGDGRAEAVLWVTCFNNEEDSGDGRGRLLIVGREADGELRERGWAGHLGALFTSTWIAGGILHVGEDDGGNPLGQVDTFSLTGDRVTARGPAPAYPLIYPTTTMPLHVTSALPCAGGLAPQVPGRLSFDSAGFQVDSDRAYNVSGANTHGAGPHFIPAGRTPRIVLLLAIGCAPPTPPGGSSPETYVEPWNTLVAFERAPDGWHELRTYTVASGDPVGYWRIEAGRLIASFGRVGGTSRESSFPLPE